MPIVCRLISDGHIVREMELPNFFHTIYIKTNYWQSGSLADYEGEPKVTVDTIAFHYYARARDALIYVRENQRVDREVVH